MKGPPFDPTKIVACSCGLVMRARNYLEHWRACKFGSGRDATAEEKKALEEHEADS